LTAANAKLVSTQNRIALAHVWGGGEVASADGMRFVVPIRTVHAGPNPKYFGQLKGVTWYNLLSDQFTGLNAIPTPGTLRDSLVLLAVVLEQQTELKPTQIMTDTGAYSDVVFGLFRLLEHASGASTPMPIMESSTSSRSIGSACNASRRIGTTYCGSPAHSCWDGCRQPASCALCRSATIRLDWRRPSLNSVGSIRHCTH
jgi:hypothetical protein